MGTSLVVIIPEGIDTLYSSSGSTHSHGHALAARTLVSSVSAPPQHVSRREAFATDATTALLTGLDGRFDASTDIHTLAEETPPAEPDHVDEQERNPHAYVGISIILGFVLMYLIDTIPQHFATSSQPQRFQISLNNFNLMNRRPTSGAGEDPEAPSRDTSSSRPSSTTVGLVIHAAADGVALGASSSSTSNLSFVIFLALMIHKAPAAFGLTSVLLKQGLSKRVARTHLIVFSLAAPVGALLTWGAAHLLGSGSSVLGDSSKADFATGALLLFSGGTFLYVAMHAMQEASSGGHEHGANGHAIEYAGLPNGMDMYDNASALKKEKPELMDTFVTVVGMLIPLLTQFGHAH